MPENPEMRDERFRAQFLLIQAAYAERQIPVDARFDEDGHALAVFATDRMLVRTSALAQVRELFSAELPQIDVQTIPGLTVLRIGDLNLHDTVAAIKAALGDGVVSLCYLLSIAPVACCPATEPDVPSACNDCTDPCPYPASGDAGRGVQVGISDTGLLGDYTTHSWLLGVTGELDELAAIDPASGLPRIPHYCGHGTFIAGVARCVAPGAYVHVEDQFPTTFAGARFDYEIVPHLVDLLNQGVDVISLSAGGTTVDDEIMLALQAFYDDHLVNFPNVAMVAAAGNNSDDVKFYPAAFDWAVGVGSLATDRRHRAWFSNFGDWVDVYAPGEALVNAYASGVYIYDEPPRKGSRQVFAGMARWSGTSFSTPLVAGLIAAHMSRTQTTAAVAAAALLQAAHAQEIPGVGPAVYADTQF